MIGADRGRHRYDGRFAIRFLGELLIVLDRLSDPRARGPVCTLTAQELAFRALIEAAVGSLDEDTSQPLIDFYDQNVEDTDVELLVMSSRWPPMAPWYRPGTCRTF